MLTTGRFLVVLALLAIAGCSANASLLGQDGDSAANKWGSSYDPQGPSIHVPSLDTALASSPGLSTGGFTLYALNHTNQPDLHALSCLSLSYDKDLLTISLTGRLTEAALYLRYDPARVHPTSVDVGRPNAVSAGFVVEPGLIAIGAAGLWGRALDARLPLARVQFAPGPDTSVHRSVSITQDNRSKVDDLSAADNGDLTVTLGWSERNTGDYDLNGEVNLGDLARIGQNFDRPVVVGNPDYAQVEVVDGDGNGEINLGDIQPIGANFKSLIKGYNVYRTPLATPDENPDPEEAARWTKVLNAANPDGPSAPRDYNGQNFRLPYTFIDACGTGNFAWYVAPTGNATEVPPEGPKSNVAKGQTGPPPGQISFEIEPPATEILNLNDEFYLGVRVSNVTGLFSANVRFEYDSSLVLLEESVPTYTGHPNFLEPPLFLAVDNVGAAQSPYTLLGFNATQTQGTAAKTGEGIIGYFKFKAIATGINAQCFRFPQSTTYIYLWGDQYGVPIATVQLGSAQNINIG